MPKKLPLLKLADAAAWQRWLATEGPRSEGVLLATIKKGANGPETTLLYAQALDEALCYGWIDSGGRKVDDSIYLFRFCPRKANSLWSKRNVGYVERLEREKRMKPAGCAAVEAAKANGRWDSAYSGSGDTEMPPDFLATLEKVPAAKATWGGLNKGNRWRIYFRMNNLKTAAGRQKRIQTDVDTMARGEIPLPPQQPRQRTKDQAHENGATGREDSSAPVTHSNKEPSGLTATTRRTRTGRPMPSYTE